jgi:ATP-dependent helicase/nuclease subunit B
VHLVLKEFYEAWGSAVTDETLSEAERVMSEVASRVIRNEAARTPMGTDLYWHMLERTLCDGLGGTGPSRGLLKAFLASEAAETGDWRPSHFELVFGRGSRGDEPGRPLQVATPKGIVHLTGKIDRVDLDADGTHCFVLDYKTGRFPRPKDAVEGLSFQLPLYMLAAEQVLPGNPEAVGGAFCQIRDRERCGRDGSLAPPSGKPRRSDPFKTPEALRAFLHVHLPERIGRIARSIAAGHFPLTELDESGAGCVHCDYQHICRIAELRPVATGRSMGTDELPYRPGTEEA